MNRRLAKLACLVVALASGGLAHAKVRPPVGTPSSPWLGRWTGIGYEHNGRFHRAYSVDFEIVSTGKGLMLIDHDRQRISPEPVPVAVSGRSLRADYTRLFVGKIALRGDLSPEGRTLTYQLTGEGMTGLEVQGGRLTRGNRAARSFFAPRTDANGRRLLAYRYRGPLSRDDGIPTSTAPAEGVDPTRLERLVKHILAGSDRISDPRIESILILRNGKLVLEEYFWGQSADNPHIISSCAKSVTSMLAGLAWDRDRLDLNRRVTAWFPDRPATIWLRQRYPITVRNMLSMSSGTEWNDSASSGQPSVQLLLTNDVANYMLDKPLIRPPGAHYNYDNGLPTLAGIVLARTMGEPLAQFADRLLFAPLGITNYRWTMLREGTPLAAGGLYLTPRAMAKLGLLMLQDGVWQGRQILSKAWVAESTRNQSSAGDYPYGFYWHLSNAQERHVSDFDGYSAIGQGGQLITVLPAQKTVIIVTASSWKTDSASTDADQPFGLINRFVVPAIKASRGARGLQ